MPNPNRPWSLCVVALCIACGSGTVTTEGVPEFGAVMAGYWMDGHTADIVWIQSETLGGVEKDSLSSNASISLSTVGDDCAKTQAYLDAWETLPRKAPEASMQPSTPSSVTWTMPASSSCSRGTATASTT